MRISDWSSDVCSSDLDAQRRVAGVAGEHLAEPVVAHAPYQQFRQHAAEVGGDRDVAEVGRQDLRIQSLPAAEIGRASCRERVSVRVDLGGRRISKKKTYIAKELNIQ